MNNKEKKEIAAFINDIYNDNFTSAHKRLQTIMNEKVKCRIRNKIASK